MKATISVLTLFCTVLPTLNAGGVERKLVADLWDAAYLNNNRAGFIHTEVYETKDGGKTYLDTVQTLFLRLKRNNTPIELSLITGDRETKAGKVTAVFMKQMLGTKQLNLIQGKVNGKQLELTHNKTKKLEPAPWDDSVIGLYRQQKLFKEKKIKPGDSFSFLSYEPSVNIVLRYMVEAKKTEEVELFNGLIRKPLLRVEVTPKKFQGVQLGTLVYWLNEHMEPIRSQVDLPGLGQLTAYRTTKAGATAPVGFASTDIGINQMVKLSRAIPNALNVRSAVYKIRVPGDNDASTSLAHDGRQSVKNAKGESFELVIKAGAVGKLDKETDIKEYTQSCYFINSDDARVKALAAKAVGRETDPWKKALAIEQWVNRNMRGSDQESMATADNIAKTLKGDCSEYAMLMAAMCRAQGIPSRTATGLIYTNNRKLGPCFSFHMWTEVLINDEWLALDATLGRGFVGATHIKIAGQSWHKTRTLAPMLPVIRVLGKIRIEVVEAR